MTKAEVRKQFRSLRKSLKKDEVKTKSKAIADLLFSRIPIHRFSVIHLFLPIIENNEPDTSIIIETLKKDFHTEIYISKSLENGEMLHMPYLSDTVLEKNLWNIQEPAHVSHALDSKAFFEKFKTEDTLILIPLLAFDRVGNRVGYGKGYYDRFLVHANPNTIKMGISLFEPSGLISDADLHDIKMDYCVTPERIYKF